MIFFIAGLFRSKISLLEYAGANYVAFRVVLATTTIVVRPTFSSRLNFVCFPENKVALT
jgi:hypothetical protein